MTLSNPLIYNVNLKDIVDIVLVAILLYYFFLLIRGTRAVQIIIGVGVLLILWALSYALKLETLYWIFHYLFIGVVVALPIVFQPELRRALGHLGRRAMMGGGMVRFDEKTFTKVTDELIWTVKMLSQTRTGAIIVLERDVGLQEYMEKGTPIHADVSSKLLLSIFMPSTPLHDGAAIIRGDQVAAAGVYLPLSDEPLSKYKGLGTRHRAAIGLSEQSDAVVIIVSEETGIVSVAFEGKLYTNLGEDELKEKIQKYFYTRTNEDIAAMIRIPHINTWGGRKKNGQSPEE
ncbi:MAG: diadenylate cyclase CdaA [Chloroflexi bacterium]|nr:diadenylate cyclase CdaA [Chloroflexota bacterium]